MHPKIEKLIKLALIDGEVTEKEKDIIFQKAESLCEDKDEVEMTIAGMSSEFHTNNPKLKEKAGNIKTCPACGSPIQSLTLRCDACGHEFTNTKSNSNLNELEIKLASAHDDLQRVKVITDHPISNDKETMFELLSYMSSKVLSANIESDSSVITAYQGRAIEIITKLTFACSSDALLMAQLHKISIKMSSKKTKNMMGRLIKWSLFSILWCLFTYLMISTIARIFGAHLYPY